MCGGERGYRDAPPLCVTQQYHPVSVFAWLSFTSISHSGLLSWVPSGCHSAVNSRSCPRIALQSLCSSPQMLHFLGDLCPCPGTYGCGRIVCVIIIPSGLSQISYFTIQQSQILHLCSKQLPQYGDLISASVSPCPRYRSTSTHSPSTCPPPQLLPLSYWVLHGSIFFFFLVERYSCLLSAGVL